MGLAGSDANKTGAKLVRGGDVPHQVLRLTRALVRVGMGEIGIGDEHGDAETAIAGAGLHVAQVGGVQAVQVDDADVGAVQTKRGCKLEPVLQRYFSAGKRGVERYG